MERAPLSDRSCRGAVGLKPLVYVVILFAVYTGYKFMSVPFSKGRVERVVVTALDGIAHRASDDGIRKRIIRRAEASSVSLAPGDIQVGREKLPGERVIHIDIAYPVTVRYLGGDRTIETDVHVTKVIEVDEAAEARRADAERRERAEIDAKVAAAGEHVGRLKGALSECEQKHGKGNCMVMEMPGGSPGEIRKLY
jgi:hypothetical protein